MIYQILKIYNYLYIKMVEIKERVLNIIETGLSVTLGLLLFVLLAWIYMKYVWDDNESNLKDDDTFDNTETIDDINDLFEDV